MAAITMYRGDTKLIDLEVFQSVGVTYNLTGCKLWFTVKASRSDADIDAIIMKDSDDNGITITDFADGLATIEILPADTDSIISSTTYVYDIQLKDASSRVFTIGVGTLTVNPDVTRTTT